MENDKDGDGGEFDQQLNKTCTVLGGGGFIGRALVDRLLRLGNWIVRVADSDKSLDLKTCDPLLADAFSSGRATYFQVDVRHKSEIIQAIQGVSVVFYTDSGKSLPKDFYICYNIIVQGAKNVVNACRECNIERLIYTSSAYVVFDNVHDIHGGDESLPYSGRVWDMVTDLRTQAEALILSANDIGGLLTCALRPCNVFGPGDAHLLPLLINIAKSNWAKFIIGSGNYESDFTYLDNVAHAHICAEESLNSVKVSSSGKAFFITNMEPMPFWEFVTLLLESFGYHRPVISLPLWVARIVVKFLNVNPGSTELDPRASFCHIFSLASHTRTFSCSAAQKHIKYSPVVSTEEGVKLTVDSFSHLAVDSPFMRYKDSRPSKVEMLLGSGKVADILLWRDEKQTFSCFLFLGFLYTWFLLSGRNLISSAANLLLLIIVLLCGHHILPLIGYGYKIPRLPASCFEVSEVDMRNTFFTMKLILGKVDSIVKSLAQGEDWSTFLKVSTFLYFCKLIIPHHLAMVTGLGLISSFTMCFVYEQYEEKIDETTIIVFNIVKTVAVLIMRKLPILSSYAPVLDSPEISSAE